MAATEVFQNNPSTTVISGGNDAPSPNTPETWTVASDTGWPTATMGVTQFHVGDPAAPSEVILVQATSGTSWNVIRGAEGSQPVAHAANFTIAQVVTAGWLGAISFVNPMTSPGDMVAGTASGLAVRVPGNTTSTKEFLTSTGSGTSASLPAWGTIATTDVPTLNQNTTGTSANVTGTVATTHGGTGLSSLTAYAVVAGGTSSTANVQQVSGVGSAGQVLTSQGAGQLPQWSPNTGGSLSIPVTVVQGGTGGTAVTAYAVVTGGTASSTPLQQVSGTGTAGQVLTSQGAGALPVWQQNVGGTIPIPVTVGGTGGTAVTAYGLVTGGTSSTSPLQAVASAGTAGQILTSNGPGVLPTWQPVSGTVAFPITVTEGGTGGTSATAYALFAGGTSSTSKFQQVASVGGSGQVLTSQGAGLLPQWAASTGGSVSFPITIGEGGTGGTTAALAITNLGAADLTSAQTLTTKTLKNTSLTFNQLGTVSTSQSISCANGNVQEFTLGTSVTISSVTGPGGTVACDLTLYIVQPPTGGPYTINSWPASINWLGGAAPTIQPGAGTVTVVTMESLNGGTAWYGAQITGAPALPLDISLGGTGATDSDGALTSLAGPGVLSIFGDGSDGNADFDGTSTVLGITPSSGNYNLTRDILCTAVTVESGATLTTSSAVGTFRIFCEGTVTINSGGTISANGNAAGAAPTAGAVLASGSLVGGRAGGAGGASPASQGSNGSNANMGVAGGTGGTASSGAAGGTAGTVTQSGVNVVTNVFNTPFPLLTGICMYGGNTLQVGFGAGGSGGGGASGEAGGGGGGGGGIVAIFAYTIVNNGTMTATGGAGGNGAGTGAGGGGGGAGGLIIGYTLSPWTGSGTTVVTGGTGGTGPGSGANGTAGGAGTVVSVILTS